jgi:glycosyltransferase involved in cell wall biosynthesis
MLLGHSTGGIGAHVDALVAGVRDAGHEVRLVTADSTADAFGWSDAVRLWPVHGGVRAPRGLLDWHRIMRLAGTVDLVHAHGHQAALVAAVAVARARPRPRLVVSLHNDLPPAGRSASSRAAHTALRRAVSWALRRADLVAGASADLVALARSFGARRTELAQVPSVRVAQLLGAPRLASAERDDLLARAGVPTDRPVVLTVSRIAPQKDLATLLEAARLSQEPATWVVVGSGDERLRARLLEEADGIRPGKGGATRAGVRFVGARDDVPDWLRAADVFVLTSRWEARALVVQEAMAAGLPVVVTRTGGLPGLVGDAGSLVPVGDPAATASEVDRLLRDPEQRARLGAAARVVATSWPSPAAEARRWAERYAETLSG